MSLPQTSINAAGQLRGLAGDIADSSEHTDILSSANGEASSEIRFGIGVVADGAQEVILPAAETDVIKGIVVRDLNHQPYTTNGGGDLGTTGLRPKAMFGVMRVGRVIVQLDDGITSVTPYTSRGWCRAVATGNEILGAWRDSDDSTDMIDCTKQAVFVSNAFALPDGTYGAVLEVDFTNPQ